MKWIAVAATIALAGCAHDAARSPGEQAAASRAPDAVYALPSGGLVRLAVLGMREVPATTLGQNGFRALVVRMVLDNSDGAAAWTVDPSEQVARIADYGQMLPAHVVTQKLTVPAGQLTTLDLLYPVPRPEYGPEMPRSVALEWRVHTTAGEIRERSVLDRQLARVLRPAL
jgi:hypothetical protein